MRIIDLSLPIDDTVTEPHPVEIVRWQHQEGGDRFGWRWAKSQGIRGRLRHLTGQERITHRTFRDEAFLSLEWVSATVHCGTHIDAPYHFGMFSEGKEPKKAEDIPLEWCFGNGVVLDCSHRTVGEEITKQDIEQSLKKIGYEIKPLDIVLLYTGTDKLWGTRQYFAQFAGVSREAIDFIVSSGVKIIGIDTFSFDRPLKLMIEDYLRTGDGRYLYPAHFYGRDKEYFHVERLANLNQIPKPYGFKVSCFPIKIKGVGAAWVRAVAIID